MDVLKDMNELERRELLTRLNADTKSLCILFGGLVGYATMSLQKSNVTAENLITYFEYAELDELATAIDRSDSISVVMSKLKQDGFWNFYNYDVLEGMFRHFCMQDAEVHKLLDNYNYEFKQYCQRRVSEVFVEATDDGVSASSPTRGFKVKMDNRFSVSSSLSVVKEVQNNIQKILNLKPIVLAHVKEGCLELYFRYFKKVLTVSEEQMTRLKDIGVLSLTPTDCLPRTCNILGKFHN